MTGRSGLEVAHIFQLYGEAYRQAHAGRLSRVQLRTMGAIESCRTAALGGHLYQCDHCGAEKICYNSCRNRHCPRCQSLDKERWLEQRCGDLLPVPYFHIVFTLPEELHPLALRSPRLIYDLLFHSASETLLQVAADPRHLGADIGLLAVLHTWGQKLTLHPHLHCIVPGGGLSTDRRRWIGSSESFFLPFQVLSRVFQGKFLAGLRTAFGQGLLEEWHPVLWEDLLGRLQAQSWVVYCKPPFGGPAQVLRYLARYTHRVAITNSRLVRLEEDRVTFTFKDYAQGDVIREMTLPAEEFLRRFLLHVLPERFVRIRYYGLLSNRQRQASLARCRQLLAAEAPPAAGRQDWSELLQRLTGRDPEQCEVCGRGRLVLREVLPRPARSGRPPP